MATSEIQRLRITFDYYGLTLISILPCKMWDGVTHPFPNVNGVWRWTSKFVAQITTDDHFQVQGFQLCPVTQDGDMATWRIHQIAVLSPDIRKTPSLWLQKGLCCARTALWRATYFKAIACPLLPLRQCEAHTTTSRCAGHVLSATIDGHQRSECDLAAMLLRLTRPHCAI